MYALERNVDIKCRGRLYTCWERYALCNTRSPLERVRAGLERPEEWRIVRCSISLGQLCQHQRTLAGQKKAS